MDVMPAVHLGWSARRDLRGPAAKAWEARNQEGVTDIDLYYKWCYIDVLKRVLRLRTGGLRGKPAPSPHEAYMT